MPLNCEQILRKCDKAVAMAKFGQNQVKNMYKINTDYIQHATDVNNFFPLSSIEKQELRTKWNLQGKFIVGSVFRNQGRKMTDRTIKAFALFAKKCPEAVLLLHTDPDDAAQVFPIQALVQRYNLENRVLYTGMKFYNGLTFKEMNGIYNLFDVFLLTTSGEGFGIPIIEAMACGIPCLVTDYTTTRELIVETGAGLGIKLAGVEVSENPDVHENQILDGTITGSWCVERGICSVKDAAEKLLHLYINPSERNLLGSNGTKAVKEIYNWNVTRPKWIKLVKDLIGEI